MNDEEKIKKVEYYIRLYVEMGDPMDKLLWLLAEVNRARSSEENLKSQILELFDYLVKYFPKDMFNENALSACKTAVEVMENQRTSMKLYGRLSELFKEETDIIKLDRKRLIELVKKMKSICLQ